MKQDDDFHIDAPTKSIDAIKARILVDALHELAVAGVGYSFYVSKIVWGVSLYLQCGEFVERWKSYPRISDAARKIRDQGKKGWRKQVTFEHARPLSQIYSLLLAQGRQLTTEAIVEIVGAYPPVLVTREENIELNKLYKKTGEPEERYRAIPYSGFELRSKPLYRLAEH
ncbi:hypothetical protein [Bradyrhizobium sp. STM 3566]|uniref:hypothetical protein n=1 Tax=Bradyrhizobium sp. STM 3566 TaxID=578928 RepID=UPI00388F12D7